MSNPKKKAETPRIVVTKLMLIEKIALAHGNLTIKESRLAADEIFNQISSALCQRKRVEIRNFGSFVTKPQLSRWVRSPKTGVRFKLSERTSVHFKAGKNLADRVDAAGNG